MGKKADTLKYHFNISVAGRQKMADMRKKFYDVAVALEELGESRELSAAFSHLQLASMMTTTHLVLVDPEATPIEPGEVVTA